MIRHFWILLLLGCASEPTREEGPLDRLISKSNAYTSFHLRGEISDGRQGVPVEMAYQAPDRAMLKYGNVATTILSGGRIHQFLRGAYGSANYVEIVDELKARYPGIAIGPAPQPVFSLGDGVRAQLTVGRLGARLGWLEEVRTYKLEENVYKHGQIEIQIRDDGFVAKSGIAGHGFVLKEAVVNAPLPEALFALPSASGLRDESARFAKDQARFLDESFHRWALETSASDETIESLIRIDLIRQYEPEKMAEILRENVRKSLRAFAALQPDARPEAVKHKVDIERGKAMGTVDIMEEELQKDYEKTLDGYFRGMAVTPPQKELLDLVRRWHAAVKRQVEEQIRRRFEAVFADAATHPDKE